ncbi:HAMP domain-containing protein, partial [Heliobacterium undosum]
MYLAMGQFFDQIDFNKKENIGVEYNNALVALLGSIVNQSAPSPSAPPSQSQGSSLSMDPSRPLSPPNKANPTPNIEAAIAQVDRFDNQSGHILKTREIWSEWKKHRQEAKPKQSLDELVALIAHVGDASNLILDPELDSYYLMDSVVNKLPNIVVKLVEVRDFVTSLPVGQDLSNEQRVALIYLIAETEGLLENEKSGLAVVYGENPAMKEVLERGDSATLSTVKNALLQVHSQVVTPGRVAQLPREAINSLTSGITQCIELHQGHSQALTGLIDQRIDKYGAKKNMTLLAFVAGMLLALYFFSALYRTLKVQVRQLQALTKEVAGGDLTLSMDVLSKDEIGELIDSFNSMVANQRQIVRTVRDSAVQLSSTMEELAASSEEVAVAASGITHSVKELAKGTDNSKASVANISREIQKFSAQNEISKQRSLSAASKSQGTLTTAMNSSATVKGLVAKMDNIREKTLDTEQMLKTLDQFTQQIDQISQTITGIASQTNLLALNAAIEAARAGEAGRGFAVVAEEVRILAERSNNEAKEVIALVQRILETTLRAVAANRSNCVEVEEGVRIAEQAGKAITEIIEAVTGTVNDIQQIAGVTIEQVTGLERVVAYISQVAKEVEAPAENAATVLSAANEIAATMENMAVGTGQNSEMARSLRRAVERFRVE